MAKRGQASVADEQIEAERKHGRYEDLAGQVDVEIAGHQRQGGQNGQQKREGDTAHVVSRPNSPCGR